MNYANKEIRTFSLASSVTQEVLQNIRTVIAFHGQRKEEERFANHLTEAKHIEIKKIFYLGLCQGLVYLFVFVSYTLTFWYLISIFLSLSSLNFSEGMVHNLFELIVQITRLVQ